MIISVKRKISLNFLFSNFRFFEKLFNCVSSIWWLNSENFFWGFISFNMTHEIFNSHLINWSYQGDAFIGTWWNQFIMTFFFPKNGFISHFSNDNSFSNFSYVVCLLIINMSWPYFWVIQTSNFRLLKYEMSLHIEFSFNYKINMSYFFSGFNENLSSWNFLNFDSKHKSSKALCSQMLETRKFSKEVYFWFLMLLLFL